MFSKENYYKPWDKRRIGQVIGPSRIFRTLVPTNSQSPRDREEGTRKDKR